MSNAMIKLIVLHPGKLRNEENNRNVINVIPNANIERNMAMVVRIPGARSTKLNSRVVVSLYVSCLHTTMYRSGRKSS
jgi:hypothetical protein